MATAEQTVTVRVEGDVASLMAAAPSRVSPRRTRRDKVYDLLREAGEQGVSLADLSEAVPMPAPHIESLIMEGHGIRCEQGLGLGKGGRWGKRWVLEKDAWQA